MIKRALKPEMRGGLFAIEGGQSSPMPLSVADNPNKPKRQKAKSGKAPAQPPPTRSKQRAKLNELKATDLTEFNSSAEEAFQHLICKMIAEEGPLTVRTIKSEAAYELNVSIERARCYLIKHTARKAHFRFTEYGTVTCCHELK